MTNDVGAALTFGTQQTGQLEKANDRNADTYEILDTCETEQEKAREKIEPKPWWQFW
jgi:hypothetical protein